MTESSYRGESYYANDGHPGDEKIDNLHMAMFKEIYIEMNLKEIQEKDKEKTRKIKQNQPYVYG